MAQAIRRNNVVATRERRARIHKVLDVCFGIAVLAASLALLLWAPELLSVLLPEANQ